jgi:drug/metabolite transporter (DMT)-like permease
MGATTGRRQQSQGVALCLASAVGFGLMAILAKEAYAAGVDLATVLVLRFALAATAFWALVAARRPVWPSRRVVLGGLALGGAGYAAQAGLFFGALTHIDASLTSLLLYTYPALVFLTALALGRERADGRRTGALVLASGGAALVLLGGGTGALEPTGVAMALGAAVVYTAYILVADRILGHIDTFLLSALIITGAFASFSVFAALSGGISLGFQPHGWLVVIGLSLVSTVMPVTAFMLGLPKVGPATASIVSTAEPVVTVTLAMVVFGERLGPVQAVGGALVLGAVVLLQTRGKVRSDAASPELPAPTPARPLAQHAA